MTSLPGADDPLVGALTPEQLAALHAWADAGDVPDDFADRVVARLRCQRDDPPSTHARGQEAAAVASRTGAEARVVRRVGVVAALAAAAAVMLMVRVLPRASEVADDPAARPASPSERALAMASEPSESQRLGAAAADVLAEHCRPCHDSTDPEAKPEALAVFDVTEPRWWAVMSDAQLEDASMRVQQLGAATDDERRTMDAFVRARLERPAHAG